ELAARGPPAARAAPVQPRRELVVYVVRRGVTGAVRPGPVACGVEVPVLRRQLRPLAAFFHRKSRTTPLEASGGQCPITGVMSSWSPALLRRLPSSHPPG